MVIPVHYSALFNDLVKAKLMKMNTPIIKQINVMK